MKKIYMRFMSLALVAVMAMGTTAFAADNVSETIPEPVSSNATTEVTPNADTVHYYSLKNRKYVSTSKTVMVYLTSTWAKANEYYVQSATTKTSTLSVSPQAGTFALSAVKAAAASAGYSTALSKSFTVGTRITPKYKDKYSKLAIWEEKAKYSGDLYYNIDFGSSVSSNYKGSGYFYEPRGLYLEEAYQS